MSKRRHNFGTKRFKEKSLFKFHARIALKSLILLFVRLIARGARIGKTHTQTDRHTDRHTDRQDKYCNPRACAPRVNKEAMANARTRTVPREGAIAAFHSEVKLGPCTSVLKIVLHYIIINRCTLHHYHYI